jgi:phosphoglycolate phosphatase-like HAD superfamily hydrolase
VTERTVRRLPIFDLDGTLLDSDEALVAPFLSLGVARDDIGFGEPVDEACRRLGVSTDDYVARYDSTRSQPFPGVVDLLDRLDRWAVCSNKHPTSGREDLMRCGWSPEVALFTDAFGGRQKRLGPVLEALGLGPGEVVYVGDSAHDRMAAAEAGCPFLVAGWNPRTDGLEGDALLATPVDLLAFLG